MGYVLIGEVDKRIVDVSSVESEAVGGTKFAEIFKACSVVAEWLLRAGLLDSTEDVEVDISGFNPD